jgi:hypothetical protein
MVKTNKQIYIEYFETKELLRLTINVLPFIILEQKSKNIKSRQLDRFMQSLIDKVDTCGIDQKSFDRILKITKEELLKDNRPRMLFEYLRSHMKYIYQKICKIPNSRDKAYDCMRGFVEFDGLKDDQVYDALVLLSDEVGRDLIQSEVKKWKKEAKEHLEDVHLNKVAPSDIFWVSLDFHEDIDGISRYRFREYFNIGEFEDTFAEVETMLELNIAPAASGMASMKDIYGSSDLQGLTYSLWLVSRSTRLTNKLRDSINLALTNIRILQSPDGWWSDINILFQSNETMSNKPIYLPSIHITALCSLVLLKLSIQDTQFQTGRLGAKWLLSKQNADGSWSRQNISNKKIVYEPDVFTTLLTLEVLIRSRLPDINYSINMGVDWLMKQQERFGIWEDKVFPFPFLTIITLEILKFKDQYPAVLDHYQSVCKGFLLRSNQLSLEDNSDSRRLAMIAAYHGLEAFLYSILSHHDVNIPIFSPKGGMTIGMRDAIEKFQVFLQNKKIIKSGDVLSFRNSLDRLAYLRDQIVHKAINVSTSDCLPLIEDSIKFVKKYSLLIFNFDILI